MQSKEYTGAVSKTFCKVTKPLLMTQIARDSAVTAIGSSPQDRCTAWIHRFRDTSSGSHVSSLRFRVSGFGYRIALPPCAGRSGFWISGFGSQVSGFGFHISGFWFQVSGIGMKHRRALEVPGSAFWVSGFGSQVSGFGFRISGFRFWVWDLTAALRLPRGSSLCWAASSLRAAPS